MQANISRQVSVSRLRGSGFRLPKPSVLVVAAGLGGLLIAYAVLGLSLMRQPQELRTVERNISNAELVLSKSKGTTQDLVAALQTAEKDLSVIQGAFPDQVQTNPFVSRLFELAANRNVQLTNIQSKKPKEQTFGQHKYVLVPFTIIVDGKPADLVAFLGDLEKVDGYTLVAKVAQLNQGVERTYLTVEVDIFTRPPAPVASPTSAPAASKAPR